MSTYQYDVRYSPPAPAISIRIVHPRTGNSLTVGAKLDTGASRTVLPLSVIRHLGLMAEGYRSAMSFDRRLTKLPLFKTTVEVADTSLENLRVFAINRPDALLGRDILNQFDITLRGKAQVFEMIIA